MYDYRHSVLSFIFVGIFVAAADADAVKARAYVFRASRDLLTVEIIGVLDFAQIGGSVKINGTLRGLTAGLHGFHVHEKGDIGNGCLDAAAHFNPSQTVHGAPEDIERHVGDLGNIITPPNGDTVVSVEDSVISLRGPFSVIGRSIVIHERADDLGRGDTEASKLAGNAGGRVACGLIGIVN